MENSLLTMETDGVESELWGNSILILSGGEGERAKVMGNG